MKDDSIEGIYDTLKECAVISKSAGGMGVSIHNIRATNSYIRGTNGTSNGIVPMLRVFNDTARYVDQGGGKRKGMFRITSQGFTVPVARDPVPHPHNPVCLLWLMQVPSLSIWSHGMLISLIGWICARIMARLVISFVELLCTQDHLK